MAVNFFILGTDEKSEKICKYIMNADDLNIHISGYLCHSIETFLGGDIDGLPIFDEEYFVKKYRAEGNCKIIIP